MPQTHTKKDFGMCFSVAQLFLVNFLDHVSTYKIANFKIKKYWLTKKVISLSALLLTTPPLSSLKQNVLKYFGILAKQKNLRGKSISESYFCMMFALSSNSQLWFLYKISKILPKNSDCETYISSNSLITGPLPSKGLLRHPFYSSWANNWS